MKDKQLVGLIAQTAQQTPELQRLAQKLALPIAQQPEQFKYLLCLMHAHIELQTANADMKPLCLNFSDRTLKKRVQKKRMANEVLLKAIGKKTRHVVDATCGLGRDTFLLAAAKMHVIGLERSRVLFTLLQDALTRAEQDPSISAIVTRIELHNTDAIRYFSQPTTFPPDAVYIDPMHPPRKKKSALVKKEMRILRDVVGEDADAPTLLNCALTYAGHRVVVKLPMYSTSLTPRKPDFSYPGKTTRYDVYLR